MEKEIILKIEKMTCVMCAANVEHALKKVDGVISATVNFANNNAVIVYNDDKVTVLKLKTAVKKAGYKAVDLNDREESSKLETAKLIITCSVALILLAVMILNMIFKSGFFLSPLIHPIFYVILQIVLSTVAAVCGYEMYIRGFKNLFALKPNMYSLVAVSTTAAYIYSMYSAIMVFKGNIDYVNNLYFESVAVIIALIMLGKFLEHSSLKKTNKAVEKLVNLMPKEAIRITVDGKEEVVSVKDLLPGDIILLKPGNSVCVDGVVVEGESAVNESMLTGESIPSDKKPGLKLFAGTINLNGTLKFKATKVGEETVLSEIIKTVENAQNTKAPIAKLADKVAAKFTPAVIIIALISACVWWIIKDFDFALTVFVSVLVIACPCSLGLATPTAIIVASGKGASMGILYKNAESIQKLAGVNTVVFDKTGTLTTGKLAIKKILPLNGFDEKQLLQIVATVESLSDHPISKAIVEYNKAPLLKADNFEYFSGSGIKAQIDGKTVITGKPSMIANINDYEQQLKDMESAGNSVIAVEIDNVLAGLISLSDTIKEGAPALIDDLKKMGIKTVMLSGDGENSVKNVAAQLKIDEYYFRVTPFDKFEIINKIKQSGKTVMVGDGINDASALAGADIGIGFSDGTDISIEAAEIVIMNNNIKNIENAIALSRFSMRVIKQNLFWAFFYNIICLTFASGIFYSLVHFLINPMIGSLAMAFSSVSVVSNALRINTFKEKNIK